MLATTMTSNFAGAVEEKQKLYLNTCEKLKPIPTFC